MTIKAKRKINVCQKCQHYIYRLSKGLNWQDEEYQCTKDGWYNEFDGINSVSGHRALPFSKYIMWKLPDDCEFKLEQLVLEQKDE